MTTTPKPRPTAPLTATVAPKRPRPKPAAPVQSREELLRLVEASKTKFTVTVRK